MSDIEIKIIKNDKVIINDSIFSKDEFERIKKRILRNRFNGEASLLRGMGGASIIREDDEFILGKPKAFPKESWSYKEWVEQSNGWLVYAKGTMDEWKDVFNSIEKEQI